MLNRRMECENNGRESERKSLKMRTFAADFVKNS